MRHREYGPRIHPGPHGPPRPDGHRRCARHVSECQRRLVEEIKLVLVERWAEATPGGSITDPELTQYAEQIAADGSFPVRT
jgi:hypothetical protein